jgi:hypothetical protein
MGGYDEESLEPEGSSSTSECSGTISEGSAPLRHKHKSLASVSPSGQPLRPIAGNTLSEVLAGGIAGASVATSVVAMVLQPANIVFAAGGLSW